MQMERESMNNEIEKLNKQFEELSQKLVGCQAIT